MIDKDVLSRLGGTRVIVNIARAAIVEPQALKVWLQETQLPCTLPMFGGMKN